MGNWLIQMAEKVSDTKALEQSLAALAKTHIQIGVKKSHAQAMQQAILYAIEQMGPAFLLGPSQIYAWKVFLDQQLMKCVEDVPDDTGPGEGWGHTMYMYMGSCIWDNVYTVQPWLCGHWTLLSHRVKNIPDN